MKLSTANINMPNPKTWKAGHITTKSRQKYLDTNCKAKEI